MKKIITVSLNPSLDKTIVLPNLCPGGLNRAESVRVDAGGKGINVSKVLCGFSYPTLALGILPQEGSECFLSELAACNIPYDFVVTEGALRTNYKLSDRKAGSITEVNEPGAMVSQEAVEAFCQKLSDSLAEAAVLVLSGSLAPGIPKEMYQKLCHMAKEKAVPVILDADGEAHSLSLPGRPYAVKPNRAELARLFAQDFPDEKSLLSGARRLLDFGISLAVVSLGAEGALFVTEDAALQVSVPEIPCQSTVGAGDSMVAAMAYSLACGYDFEALARLSAGAGTATVQKPGSEVCNWSEAKSQEVFVKKL